jgi:hypothetical protein
MADIRNKREGMADLIFGVNIPSSQDSRFPVIDRVWESESFVGFRNFTLIAVRCRNPANANVRSI